MTLDDRQVETLLRKLPLAKPSTSLDARVMARPTLKIWSYVGAGSALARSGTRTSTQAARKRKRIMGGLVEQLFEDEGVNVADFGGDR